MVPWLVGRFLLYMYMYIYSKTGRFREDSLNLFKSTAYACVYSKTSLNRPTIGLTLNDPISETVSLGSWNMLTMDRLGPK